MVPPPPARRRPSRRAASRDRQGASGSFRGPVPRQAKKARLGIICLGQRAGSRAPKLAGSLVLNTRALCRASDRESYAGAGGFASIRFFADFTTLFGFCTKNNDYSNNLEDTVDATSTAYRASSSLSFNAASSHNVADANARAQSMATPLELTRHSFEEPKS